MGAGRDLDVVIYGASGYVGGLAAAYLATTDSTLTVALAGRSAERLRATRRKLGAAAADWPILVAELDDRNALRSIASRARLVISTVGPYTRVGLPVVAACAAAGTDYADLTGEVPFVRDSIARHHDEAVESGARIVHSCGFDSVPSDLTAYALYRAVDGELADATLVLRAYSGGYGGGSIATMLDLMRLGATDPGLRRLLDDPYSLSPNRRREPDLGPQPDMPLCRGADVAPQLRGLWLGGHLMALYNTRCVRRSNALLGWAYGRRLRYTELMSWGSTPAAPTFAAMNNAAISGASRLGGEVLRWLPNGFAESVWPKPGTGYDQGARGHYRVETYATTTRGDRYVASMAQQADPGYSATAVILGQCALALLRDDDLPDRTGVLTPAVAIGDALLRRLPAAGVTVEVAGQGR